MIRVPGLLPAVLVACAVLVGGVAKNRGRHRLRALRMPAPPTVAPQAAGRSSDGRAPSRLVITVVLLSVPVMWLAVGAVGLLLAVTVVAGRAARHRRRTRRPAVGVGEAALFAELLSAYLGSGTGLPQALRRAGDTGPVLARLSREVANALSAGLKPDEAWAPAGSEPAIAGIARICIRSAMTGSGCADELLRLARRMRHRHEQEVERRAERAAIWLVLPLGACFLPAFVLLTVVPVVAGLLPGLP